LRWQRRIAAAAATHAAHSPSRCRGLPFNKNKTRFACRDELSAYVDALRYTTRRESMLCGHSARSREFVVIFDEKAMLAVTCQRGNT